jgi:DNA-binding PadR family transcriptional regulator
MWGEDTRVKLRPISFLVLGLLRLGATSGYAIKKAADAATSSIWPVSLAQVYPELARLEEQGLVTRQEDPYGARARSAYALTEKGEEALLAWLRSPYEVPAQFRIEGMLRFFFVDALPKREQIVMVQRAQERLRDYGARMYDKDLRGALADIEEGGIRAPVLAGLFGEALLRRGEEWLAELEALLRAEADAEPPNE